MAEPRLAFGSGFEPVERAAGRFHRRRGDVEVAGGGAEAVVPEQDLDRAEVGTGLEQVGGEAVSQGMHMDVLAQSRSLQGTPADHLDGARADRPVGLAPREEVRLGPVLRPVRAGDGQESRREHHVAVLVSLALADVEDHAGAVDVLDAEPGDRTAA